jgi:hypothetical protein
MAGGSGSAAPAVGTDHVRSAGAAYSGAQTVDHENREKDDFYPTWPGATAALLSVERFDGAIWECAAGEGDMSRVLAEAGYDVVSTDLIDRGYCEARVDFLMEWTPRAPNIVTNPPFGLAREFVDKALALTTGKVAMFLRLAFLETLDRGLWFPTTPLARVWIMSRRVPMQRGRISEKGDGHGVIAFAWFVWEHGHEGPATLHWLDWLDHAADPRAAIVEAGAAPLLEAMAA